MGHAVPIPNIRAIGAYDTSLFYPISDWLPGRTLTEFDRFSTESLLSSLFDGLLAMSRVDVLAETGFGILNGQGKPRIHYARWADFIGDIDSFPFSFTPRGQEQYRPWHELYAHTFLDRTIVKDACQRLGNLLPFLPNERHYVHGDFGYDNVLADQRQLTAILDWAELRRGDWLYDLAYVVYHNPMDLDYIAAFRQWAARHGLLIEKLKERMQAYCLHIFLGNIFLEANRNQPDWYAEDVERYQHTLRLLADDDEV